jgi:beta-lactamase superfamily II metal-dependent hydrolase
MRRLSLTLLLCLACLTALVGASKTLDMWVIDTEGGKALLIVSPSGRSMLVDTGFPGNADRDTNRILEACRLAGVKQLDVLLTTHYDLDHVNNAPSLVARMPVTLFVDHGPPIVSDERTLAAVKAYEDLRTGAKHLVVKPGDAIPLAGVDVKVVSSARESLKTALKGAGKPNPACAGVERKTWTRADEDNSENSASVGILLTYGAFRMLDLGDLTWNREMQLVCPEDLIGPVDLFMASHHGVDLSNNPALVSAVRPRVAVMNNGTRKGGAASTIALLKAAPGLQALYQSHWSTNAGDGNPPAAFLANLQDSTDGNWIKIAAQDNGTMTVTNGRTGESTTYKR